MARCERGDEHHRPRLIERVCRRRLGLDRPAHWSEEADRRLLQGLRAGASYRHVARVVGRSATAVKDRTHHLRTHHLGLLENVESSHGTTE